jgi:hypothetical protein
VLSTFFEIKGFLAIQGCGKIEQNMNKERTENEHAGMEYSQADRSKMKE